MEEVKKVPRLRFPGFEINWEEKKFGDLATNKSQKYNPVTESNSQKCIELEHIESNSGRLLGYSDSLTLSSIKNRFYKNDVLFGKLRPYLRKFLLAPFDGVCTTEIWVLSGKKCDNGFLFNLIQTTKFIGLTEISSGSKMPRADWGIISSTTFHFPPFPEQQKIASFLTAVDTKIEQLTKKKLFLQRYNKGVMQKIFSQEIRFKDENGKNYPDWEEKKLGDLLLDFKLGGNYSNSEVPNENPLIKMGNMLRGNITIDKLEYIKNGEVIDEKDRIKYGDLFFNTRNTLDLVGKVAIWRDELPKAYYNSNLMRMKYECNEFMNYYLNSYRGLKSLKRIATGTTSVAAIYTKDLLKIELALPCLEEQTQIADFFSAIDDKIGLVHTQLEKTQEFKKGLLQQMFV